jgi:hypothetical protein
MTSESRLTRIPPIESSILTIRGRKVILDSDLAELYGVATKVLNQAIKRNTDRFPPDFIFLLTTEEKKEVVTNHAPPGGVVCYVWESSSSGENMSRKLTFYSENIADTRIITLRDQKVILDADPARVYGVSTVRSPPARGRGLKRVTVLGGRITAICRFPKS